MKLVLVLALGMTLALVAPSGSVLAKEKSKDKEPARDSSSEKPEATTKAAANDRYENLGLFQKVLFFIEQNYVEDVKNKDLIYGAIRGMMDTLDPHSNFLPPEVFKDMKTDTSGKFGGIGIEIGQKDSILTVVSPIDDTPAYRAGLKAGDKILKINGESTKGVSLSEAVSKMRGKRGSDVLIQIWRDGFERPKDYHITRAEIKIQTTKSEELEAGYVYARLANFNERSTDDIKKVFENYEKKQHIRGLVFDLRNNPGGLLDQAVGVTSLFVDEGVVVSTRGRGKEADVQYAKKGMARKDFPVAVLVNGASASAAEIVAGALQDHKRAVVMGQPTFGKGSVQTVVELAPEMGLKLTIARYYTPNGRSIQLKGIQPDIVLDDLDQKTLDEAMKKGSFLRERDLKHHMANETEENKEFRPEEYMAKDADREKSDDDKKKKDKKDELKPFVAKEDYQVRQALNYLKGYSIFKQAMERIPSEGVKTASEKSVK